MKRFLQMTSAVLCVSMVVACNKKDDSSSATTPVPTTVAPTNTNVNQSGFFFYVYREGACDTGSHQFGTKLDLCNGLLNDALNNNCARFLRQNDFNIRCQGVTGTALPGAPAIPAQQPIVDSFRSVWCSIAAVDQSGEFLSGLRNRNNYVPIVWDSRQAQSFNLPFGAAGRYGEASLRLTPAKFGGEPEAEIVVKQTKDGIRTFSSKGALQTSNRLMVDDSDNQTTVVLDCMSTNTPTAAQQAPSAAITAVECTGRALRNDRDRDHRRDEGGNIPADDSTRVIVWNGQGTKAETLRVGDRRDRVSLDIRLSQASALERALIEVEGTDFDGGKRIVGRGSLKTGFSMKHVDRNSGKSYEVSCRIK